MFSADLRSSRKRTLSASAAAILCAGIAAALCVGESLAMEPFANSFTMNSFTITRARSSARKVKASPPAHREAPVPFRIGEKLNYSVAWASFTSAASIQLTIPERRELTGWGTWHFRASAHTLSPMRSIFSMDDQFDSYTDAATLESRQYETYLNEAGQKQTEIFHLLSQGQAASSAAPSIIVSPGTHDPLGAVYALRSIDWQKTPEFKAPVYDGHDVYEIRASLEVSEETIAVAAGNFSSAKISIRLFQRGKEVPGTSFAAWLAHDGARTPVLMVAEMPFGNLRAELVSASQ
jgi:hypothetical protein